MLVSSDPKVAHALSEGETSLKFQYIMSLIISYATGTTTMNVLSNAKASEG